MYPSNVPDTVVHTEGTRESDVEVSTSRDELLCKHHPPELESEELLCKHHPPELESEDIMPLGIRDIINLGCAPSCLCLALPCLLSCFVLYYLSQCSTSTVCRSASLL
jgi:hypothetical protein